MGVHRRLTRGFQLEVSSGSWNALEWEFLLVAWPVRFGEEENDRRRHEVVARVEVLVGWMSWFRATIPLEVGARQRIGFY